MHEKRFFYRFFEQNNDDIGVGWGYAITMDDWMLGIGVYDDGGPRLHLRLGPAALDLHIWRWAQPQHLTKNIVARRTTRKRTLATSPRQGHKGKG
jgi:hypothetical protein